MLKLPPKRQYQKYGKEYEMEYKHRIYLWVKYRIRYTIDNAKYGVKIYNKTVSEKYDKL